MPKAKQTNYEKYLKVYEQKYIVPLISTDNPTFVEGIPRMKTVVRLLSKKYGPVIYIVLLDEETELVTHHYLAVPEDCPLVDGQIALSAVISLLKQVEDRSNNAQKSVSTKKRKESGSADPNS